MDRFDEGLESTLYWVQPGALRDAYELRSRDKNVATLTFKSVWGTMATAQTAASSWTFKRVGFLNARVTVREAGKEADLAVYWPRFWGDGWLDFPGGRRYRWQSTNFWKTHWALSNAAGEQLFTLRPGLDETHLSDLFKTQASVEVLPAGRAEPDLPLLRAVTWYLMVLQQHDSAVAVSGAGAAAVV